MNEIIKITFVVSILGAISSGIGGIISSLFDLNNKKYISILQQITAGIMTGIVCFDMLPEAFNISNVFFSLIGVIIGISVIYFLEELINKINTINSKKYTDKYIVSIVIMISMTFHNIIEGIAIGSSFSYSFSMGITVIIAIILHDIPEGIVIGVLNNIAGKSKISNIINTTIVGIVTGLGAFLGGIIGNINELFISLSLSIAAGIMLYIISCEFMPNSYSIYSTKKINISYIIGIIIGAIIVYV